MIAAFLIALQFLTAIPVKIKEVDDKKMSGAMLYFPLVGLLLGGILADINHLLLFLNFEWLSINIMLVVSLIILTAGLHLDGLADTADAFLSAKDKDQVLEVMRDPHIGVMGVLGITSVILLKVALLGSISVTLKGTALLLMCIFSRWAMVMVMSAFPYARQEGKARAFINGANFKIFTLATLITLTCAFVIWQIKGLLIFSLAAISACTIAMVIKKRINGVTGDTLGAINELTELTVLLAISVMERSLI